MDLKRLNIPTLPFQLLLIAIALGFTGCSALTDSGFIYDANESVKEGPGEGYGGKVYIQNNIAGNCADGTSVSSKIYDVDDKSAWLLRENCQSLSSPRIIALDSRSAETGQIVYMGQTFDSQDPYSNDLIMKPLSNIADTIRVDVPFSMQLNFKAIPLGAQGYKYCLHYLDENHEMVAYRAFTLPARSDLIQGNISMTVSDTIPASMGAGTYDVSASLCRWTGVQFDYIAMAMGTNVVPSPEGHSVYIVGEISVSEE